MIITGEFKSGEKIPSVRDLANDAKVNPNTMQKALMELEDMRLIFTKRTSGKYVTEDKKRISVIKEQLVKESIIEFLNKMKQLNVSEEKVNQYLKEMK